MPSSFDTQLRSSGLVDATVTAVGSVNFDKGVLAAAATITSLDFGTAA
jgi:hypothetical protein